MSATGTERLDGWLRDLVKSGGSDLLLVADVPPCIRVEGVVHPLSGIVLTSDEIEKDVFAALHPHAQEIYRQQQITDASYRIAEVGRFRINLHRERGRAAAAIRALPTRVPAF